MLVNPDINAVFLRHWRTASAGTGEFLKANHGFFEAANYHESPWTVTRPSKEAGSDQIRRWNAFKNMVNPHYICTVRNPFDAMVSMFYLVKWSAGTRIGTEVNVPFLKWWSAMNSDLILPDSLWRHAWDAPQDRLTILRFENLAEDTATMLARFGLDSSVTKFVRLNRTKDRPTDAVQNYFTAKAVEWMEARYAKDLNRFNHTFEGA